MGTFLDQRSSANKTDSSTPTVVGAPALWGVVGLQTRNVANPIVDLTGTFNLNTGTTGTVRINVVRGSSLAGTIIYTHDVTLVTAGQTESVAVVAQDLAAPAAIETVYTAFVSLVAGAATRTGPETFWGLASSST